MFAAIIWIYMEYTEVKTLTTGPSSRPLAPNNCEPGLFITRTGTPIYQNTNSRVSKRRKL